MTVYMPDVADYMQAVVQTSTVSDSKQHKARTPLLETYTNQLAALNGGK